MNSPLTRFMWWSTRTILGSQSNLLVTMLNRQSPRNSKRSLHVPRNVVTARRFRHGSALSQRTRGLEKNQKYPFAPPENWYEPTEERSVGYKIIEQAPGPGYVHVVTPHEIRDRLSQLPDSMIEPLETVQLSRMTRKKQSLPCYGMQWGSTLYLYPIEKGFVEYYSRPPRPSQITEAKMFGARWIQGAPDEWRLVWTEPALKDYYLNNILIHELGHLLDDRNNSYVDRERYAEWFAIEHGYKKSERPKKAEKRRNRRSRRHHGS